MKFVTFKQLKIKNFLSIGNTPVIVDFTKGVHIITGINRDKEDRRNGVGKSTVADALYFAIFGSTIRDIKKDFVVNNITQGQCEVQLEFHVNSPRGSDDFLIVRTLNPSKLYVYKNGKDKTRDSIANTTEYIEAVLSSSSEIFQNCVIMTLNNTIPFMAKGKVEKRKFIEQIFNLQIFSQMMSILRDEHNEVKKTFDIEVAKHDEIKNSIETYKQSKEQKTKEKNLKIQNIKQKIQQNITTIENLKLQHNTELLMDFEGKNKDLTNLNEAYDRLESKIEQLVIDITEINSNVKNKSKLLSEVGTDNDVCPTCLRPITDHDKTELNEKKNKFECEIVNLNSDLNSKKNILIEYKDKHTKIKKHIGIINDELNNFKIALNNKNALQSRIEGLIDINNQLNESINSISDSDNTFDTLIQETSTRLENVKTEIDNIKKVINLLDVVKFVVSEEGVKSYIVKKILQNFNSKLAFYLKRLDSNSICVFNEYFEEEILNEKGKLCSYNNFSGAERKAIDLACLFSFMDMRKSQGDVHYNISLYDELFDSSLDEKGVELVLDILKERCEKHNEAIYIISHRKESTKFATGDIIFLEKHNGITKRVNFVD
jgi:DNA repair exonuclease SbcCD ATPase subunit